MLVARPAPAEVQKVSVTMHTWGPWLKPALGIGWQELQSLTLHFEGECTLPSQAICFVPKCLKFVSTQLWFGHPSKANPAFDLNVFSKH